MSWRDVWKACVSPGIPRRAFWTAAIVGTILNAINQGDVMAVGGAVTYWKIALTYMVPYCAFTFGAASAQLKAGRAA